jgi:hypothetical protein
MKREMGKVGKIENISAKMKTFPLLAGTFDGN